MGKEPANAPVTALSLIFFVSGASALIFENAWFHLTGLVFGNSVWASSIVLAGFMGGLALGNGLASRYGHRIQRYMLAYAIVETAIALTGVALTLALPSLTSVLAPLFRLLAERPLLLNFVRLFVAFLLLMVPTTAMGATLPLLVKALCRWNIGFGGALGRLYGWNTFGAVAGVLAAEALLVERYGIRGSAFVAAALNVGAAAGAAWLSREEERGHVAPEVTGPAAALSWRGRRVLLAAFLSGATLLALEVVWFRFLSMFIVVTPLSFALMLAVVLGGIALGGLLAALWLRKEAKATRSLPAVACLSGILLIGTYALFQTTPLRGMEPNVRLVITFALKLMLPVSTLSGVLFTLQGQRFKEGIDQETRAAGLLTLANTVGAMCGAFLAGFLLLPTLGMERSFFALALGYGVIAICVAREETKSRWTAGSLVAGGVLLLSLVFFPFGLMTGHYFPASVRSFTQDGSRIVAAREGRTETILYVRKDVLGRPLHTRLVTDGFSMSATITAARRYMQLYAYWPVALMPTPPKSALVMCFGVGVTAQAVTRIRSLETIDLVDISRDVLEMSDLIYGNDGNEQPLRDPRLRVHIEDGRFFLQTTKRKFDLITGEPPPPRRPLTINLYTEEYYRLIHDRLTDGGVVTYWIPTADLLESETKGIIKAFCNVFEDCSLWAGTGRDWMLVGSRGMTGPVTEEYFARQWQDDVVGPQIRNVGFESPEQIGATFMADAPALAALTQDALAFEDNYPKRMVPLYQAPPPERDLFFWDALNTQRARALFANSPYIERLWPASLRDRSLPYFDAQTIINRLAFQGRSVLASIDDIHYLLTKTNLRVPVLWMLNSSEDHQIIVDSAPDDGSGIVAWNRGSRAMADRKYEQAAGHFRQGYDRHPDEVFGPLLVYALCMAGEPDTARSLAESLRQRANQSPDEIDYWRWLDMRFNLRAATPP